MTTLLILFTLQSDESCLQLKLPDHTDDAVFLVQVKRKYLLRICSSCMFSQCYCREHYTDGSEGAVNQSAEVRIVSIRS